MVFKQFKTKQWDGSTVKIGGIEAWFYTIKTPQKIVKCLAWEASNGDILHTSAENSYCEETAEFIVSNTKTIKFQNLKNNSIENIYKKFEFGKKFDQIIVAPPEIKLFRHFPEEIYSRTHLVCPAFNSEFPLRISAKDFRHQMGRKDGWRVHIYRWDRKEKTQPSWP